VAVEDVSTPVGRKKYGRGARRSKRGANVIVPDMRERVMDEQIRRALTADRVIDITTIGRRSGQPRRVEIWFHNLDGRLYITGTPGKRDWYANLLAQPRFTFHLKESVTADLPARATPVTDPALRRRIMARILEKLGRPADDLEARVAGSPLVAVTLDRG
jgi:deazaflavin-dependent oxidoreductase (nitroreductase family)